MKFKKVLYLGPRGSYSDAVKSNFSNFYSENCEFIELNSIHKITENLIQSNSDEIVGILPIENSIEGIVRETQDKLNSLMEHGIRIFAETTLSVEHSLLGFANTLSDIKIIRSHPQALAQCQNSLIKICGENLKQEPTFSTSAAVSSLSQSDISIAAVGSKFCANIYKIPVIQEKINDEINNTTRFLLLSKNKPYKAINNKVSICFSTENKSGTLNKVLSVLEKYNINLSYIDSRPSRKELGEYVFYADFAGHISDNNISLALIELETSVKMLNIISEGALI